MPHRHARPAVAPPRPATGPRRRAVCAPAFGARLKELRGSESRQAVCDAVQHDFGLFLDRSTLLQYERGTVKAPDPVMLYALARHYGLDGVDALIELLVRERLGRSVERDAITRSPFDRDQRKIAEWYGEFSADSKQAVMLVLSKLRAAEHPRPTLAEPVRRRTRV